MIAKGFKRMAAIKYGPHAGKPGWYHPGTRQVVPDEEVEGGAEATQGAEAEPAPEPPKPEQISDNDKKVAEEIFRKHPELNTVFFEMGHGFGKAKYDGRCKLTGAPILQGRTARYIRGITRSGQTFDTYSTQEMLELLDIKFVDYNDPNFSGVSATKFQPCSGEWWSVLDAAEAAGKGTLTVLSSGPYASWPTIWKFDPIFRKWIKSQNHTPFGGAKSTTKQLQAALKRSNHSMWKLNLD